MSIMNPANPLKTASNGGGTAAGSNVPTGGIIIWSGAADAVPDGWALCDGQNGTPDLRGRFVLGSGEKYAVGDAGGEEEHLLSGLELTPHYHGIMTPASNEIPSRKFLNVDVVNGKKTQIGSNTENTYVGDFSVTSQNQIPFSIMPPYYVLAYIMKL